MEVILPTPLVPQKLGLSRQVPSQQTRHRGLLVLMRKKNERAETLSAFAPVVVPGDERSGSPAETFLEDTGWAVHGRRGDPWCAECRHRGVAHIFA